MDLLKVNLDGEFFTRHIYELGLEELAVFSNIDVSRLSWDEKDLEQHQRDMFKEERAMMVRNITVTIGNGFTFNGDEISQNRMNRAITVLSRKPEGTTTIWVLEDNRKVSVTLEMLLEALELAGSEQTELWPQ